MPNRMHFSAINEFFATKAATELPRFCNAAASLKVFNSRPPRLRELQNITVSIF
jgi:hypothetical protein